MKGALIASALTFAGGAFASPSLVAERQSSSSSLPAITIKGNAFFRPDGSRFYIRGVDYQPGGSSDPVDPIANSETCARDIKYFQELGLNTIRVYTVDNSANHDECMSALAAAGMYLALDVNNGHYAINRADPKTSYNEAYLQSVFATIDAFAGYSNTLLFFSGNEVINTAQNSNSAPYIKAVTRDMRQYLAARKYRQIPVGYSAADVQVNRFQTAQYMNCGSDTNALSDFYAFNDYEWCDPNTFTGSGWAANVQQYGNYSIPLFLSEYGCIKTARHFQETGALYNTEMTSVYSGGLVYEYSNEADNLGFGLVNITSSTEVSTLPDFSALQTALKNAPSPSGDGGAKTGGSISPCPPTGPNWNISPFTGEQLPAIPGNAAKFMSAGAGKGLGINGGNSIENGGQESSGIAVPNSGPSVANHGLTQAGSSTSSSSSTSSTGAAVSDRVNVFSTAPYISAAVVLAASLVGATLL